MPSSEVDRLAERACRGDRAAFVVLVERLQAPLFRFLCSRTGSREDAEELTQETFLRAWRFLDRYDPRRSFSTWLYTLAGHLTISERRRRRPGTVESDCASGACDDAQPAGILSAREEWHNLWCLARRVLSADQHAALWLRYGEELDIADVAHALDKRESTVRVILFRARERLARTLERDGSVPATAPQAHMGLEPRIDPGAAR